jgi:hypothetical protein
VDLVKGFSLSGEYGQGTQKHGGMDNHPRWLLRQRSDEPGNSNNLLLPRLRSGQHQDDAIGIPAGAKWMSFHQRRVSFAQKVEFSLHSANGAEYDSQGQALSAAKRVAPG